MKRVLITIDINNFQRENSRESMIHASNRWGVEFLPFSNKYYGDNFGVTFNKAGRGEPPLLVPIALKGAIPPIPLDVKPINVSVFVQLNKVEVVPVKLIAAKVVF